MLDENKHEQIQLAFEIEIYINIVTVTSPGFVDR